MADIDLPALIRQCIDRKMGNTEFALFYFPGEDNEKEEVTWHAHIGNRSEWVCLGEIGGELSAAAGTPEEAVSRLLEVIENEPQISISSDPKSDR